MFQHRASALGQARGKGTWARHGLDSASQAVMERVGGWLPPAGVLVPPQLQRGCKSGFGGPHGWGRGMVAMPQAQRFCIQENSAPSGVQGGGIRM